MKIYITGISKGLGKALAIQFLQQGNSVVGIGRSHDLSHPLFHFVQCDLGNIDQVRNLSFDSQGQPCMLINNAGVIGSIKRVSDQDVPDIEEVMTVNTITPMLLCRQFLMDTAEKEEAVIVNISSGAASRSIPGWASYCSSKAALDRFSETIYLEEQEKGHNVRVYSVSPGVIDTEMQQVIRSADPADFSSLNTFRELASNGELQSPQVVAAKLLKLLELPYDGRVVCSLRDIDN
jgi:benzil reductase ((S)-benzoin forming)